MLHLSLVHSMLFGSKVQRQSDTKELPPPHCALVPDSRAAAHLGSFLEAMGEEG